MQRVIWKRSVVSRLHAGHQGCRLTAVDRWPLFRGGHQDRFDCKPKLKLKVHFVGNIKFYELSCSCISFLCKCLSLFQYLFSSLSVFLFLSISVCLFVCIYLTLCISLSLSLSLLFIILANMFLQMTVKNCLKFVSTNLMSILGCKKREKLYQGKKNLKKIYIILIIQLAYAQVPDNFASKCAI